MNLMVWSPSKVGTMARKVSRKIFQQRGVLIAAKGPKAFYDEGGVAGARHNN